MDKLPVNLLTGYRQTEKRALLTGQIIVILMMACLAAAFVQAGERLAQNFQGGYLIAAAILIALESMATRKQTEDLDFNQRLIFHLSEWVAIAVLLKIMLYLIHGPGQILKDLILWQRDFFQNFFTGEYSLALLILLGIWFCSRSYSDELNALYRSNGDAGWEDLGKLQNILHEIRDRTASRVFLVGALVTGLAVFSRLPLLNLLKPVVPQGFAYIAPIINVLIYFCLSLLLLSQTQFALLQTRWLWQKLPVGPNVTQNWLKYGLLFFLALSILVIILPTHYSIGFFDVLGIGIAYLVRAFSFLIFLVTLPLTLCLSLFSLVAPKGDQTPTPPQPLNPIQPPAPGNPIAWLEFVRSLAFWVIFLTVIFLAIRYYLIQNTSLWNYISRFPLFRWVNDIWHGFWDWIRGANRQIVKMIQQEIRRVQKSRARSQSQSVLRFFNLERMNPRNKIIYFYLSLLDIGSQQGLTRKAAQTPSQYEKSIAEAVPNVKTEVQDLTAAFIEARYSQHPLEEAQSRQAGSLLDQIKTVLTHRNQKN